MYDYYITPEEYEIAKRNGINKNVVEDRIRKCGWNKKKAITIPKSNRKRMFSKDILDLARKKNIPYSTLRYRVEKIGISPIDAIFMEKQDSAKNLKRYANQKYPKYILDLAQSNGISKSLFYYRVGKMRMTILKAATTPLINRSEYMREKNKNHIWRIDEEIRRHKRRI